MISVNRASKREVEKYRNHARFLVRHYFGGEPKRLHFLTSGLSNFVFAVRHTAGNFIVRISPDATRLDVFIKEHGLRRRPRNTAYRRAKSWRPVHRSFLIRI